MKILYKHRTRGQAVEAVHIKGIMSGFESHGCDMEFSSPPIVTVGSTHQSLKNRLVKLISLNIPTVFYEIIILIYNLAGYKKCMDAVSKKNFGMIYERYAFFDFSTYFVKIKKNIPLTLEVNGIINRKDPTHGRKIILKKIGARVEKILFKKADLLVVVSSSLKNDLLALGIEENKILVLPNAIDGRIFDNDVSGIKIRENYSFGDKKVIGFIGSFLVWHGVELLVEVFSLLLKKRKDIHLLLVGDGRERNHIEKMVTELGMTEYVTLTGNVPHKDVPEYIAAMDIGTMPNSNNFGSPMKIFEYMAFGKPIVSAAYAPILEVVENGVSGFLFEPNNSDMFMKSLERLLDDNELAKKMGSSNLKYVYENHTWEKNTKKILDHYEPKLKKPGKPQFA